jgi:hypothetical protein
MARSARQGAKPVSARHRIEDGGRRGSPDRCDPSASSSELVASSLERDPRVVRAMTSARGLDGIEALTDKYFRLRERMAAGDVTPKEIHERIQSALISALVIVRTTNDERVELHARFVADAAAWLHVEEPTI